MEYPLVSANQVEEAAVEKVAAEILVLLRLGRS